MNNTPFVPQRLEEERAKDKYKIFTIRLNEAEYKQLEADKKVLEQVKDGTTIKTMWQIGRNVLHSKNMGYILATLFKNKRNNKLNNIVDFE